MKFSWPIKIVKVKDKKAEKLLKDLYEALSPGYSSTLDLVKSKMTGKEKDMHYKSSIWILKSRIDVDDEKSKKLLKALQKTFNHIYKKS